MHLVPTWVSLLLVRVFPVLVVLVTLTGCEGPLELSSPGPGPAPTDSEDDPLLLSSPALSYFESRESFELAASGLVVEDFEDAVPEPGTAAACPGPVNSETDNGCFAAGAIREGITMRAVEIDWSVVLRPPLLGLASTAVGPNWMADQAELVFTSGATYAVGVGLLAPMGGGPPATAWIEIFGLDDALLGTAEAPVGEAGGIFWGVTSEEPIARLRFTTEPDVGLLFDVVAFGETASPATALQVVVDVRQKAINPASRGMLPVAVLSSDDFDAAGIDPATVTLGPGQAAPARGAARVVDLNGDGRPDLLLHFPVPQVGLACGDSDVLLQGETLAGEPIEGTGAVRVLCVEDSPGPAGGRADGAAPRPPEGSAPGAPEGIA